MAEVQHVPKQPAQRRTQHMHDPDRPKIVAGGFRHVEPR